MHNKNLLVIIILMGVTVWLQAQITVTNATFPAAGDSLRTATDPAPAGIVMTAPGGPYTWDYSSLTSVARQTIVFQPAANGSASASFPNAELVTIGPLGAETYYDVSASAFSNLGVSGFNLPGGLSLPTALVFHPPLPERHAPLTFPNAYVSNSIVAVAIPASAIPAAIFDSLGIPAGLLDSIRIRLTVNRFDLVDAYGMLSIPGGTFDVLRVKRTDYNSRAVDVHTFLGWVDLTAIAGPIMGLGTDTTVTFNFFNNVAKEPIAIVTVDSSGLNAQQVEFKDLGVPNAVNPVAGNRPEVHVSPNPITNQATFEFKNIVSGQYNLIVYDMNGETVFAKELTSDHQVVSLESLGSGIYLYHVVNGNNQIMATGKLLKIDP